MTRLAAVFPSRLHILRWPSHSLLAMATMALSACGGNSNSAPASGPVPQMTQASASNLEITGSDPGVSPFISTVNISGSDASNLASIEYSIQPKPGSVSKPVDVQYGMTALISRGLVSSSAGIINLPVFGLYDGYANEVSVQLQFRDGSAKTLPVVISTAPYTDPTGIYDRPTIIKNRAAGSALGFDFFVMKSALGSPVVVDTDAAIRWVVPFRNSAFSSAFQYNEFVIGDRTSPTLYRLQLDGTLSQSPLQPSIYTSFFHNIDPGKLGLFADVDTDIDGVAHFESTLAEITTGGMTLNRWDLGDIISTYMQSHGDDPSIFVRPAADWFHLNCATYDRTDDTVIVSSRENFVIKLDYRSGNIIWILGDPTKYWYTFPSLRAKALNLAAGGLYPIGQHGISMTSDGLLMVFNDGLGSTNQPAGAPAGETRTYSAVSAYAIDAVSMTARNAWNFDYGQSIYSPVCGSAYEASEKSILVDFATADNLTQARLVGLDANHNVVFDFEYVSLPCQTSWNAVPIAFDKLVIS